jgi:hypothetical protein
MGARSTTASVLVSVAAGVLGAGPAAARDALPTIVQDDAQLLHRPTAQVAGSLDRLRDLGVDTVRVTAGWSTLTRDPDSRIATPGFDQTDPAAYEQARFGNLDRLVRMAAARGLRVMIDLAFWAPHWATSDPPGPRARTNVDESAYARFAQAVARRYSGRWTPPAGTHGTGVTEARRSSDDKYLDDVYGTADPPTGTSIDLLRPLAPPGGFPVPVLGPRLGTSPQIPVLSDGDTSAADATGDPLPAVRLYTIWNEPNHPAFLQPQWRGKGAHRRPASPGLYRRMVRAAYPAVKAIAPDATVLVGGTAAQSAGTGGVTPLRFLRELACVDGQLRPRDDGDCRGYTALPGDGWAHHPYSLKTVPSAVPGPDRPDEAPIGALSRLLDALGALARSGRIAPALAHVWITEYGYETNPPDKGAAFSTGDQARFLTWAEFLAWKEPGVVSFAQFLVRDLPPAATQQSLSRRRAFGQWESGLFFADGTPKLATDSFAAGIFARATGHGVRIWGRIRTGGPGPVRRAWIEARVGGGRWRIVRSARTGGHGRSARNFTSTGVVDRHLASRPVTTRYRLRWTDPTGTTRRSPSVRAIPR